jgi:tetratricopeptide (TPR) repeat protein
MERRETKRWYRTGLGFLLMLGALLQATAADLQEVRELFTTGDYAGCITACEQALKQRANDEDWSLLLSDALLTTGQYPEARTVVTNALAAHRQSVRLCWQAREAFLANGQVDAARQMLESIGRIVWRHPSDFSDAGELVISGKTAVLLGADPKKVLDRIFAAAQKAEPKARDVYLAAGELALDKHDFALAAKKFQEGLAQLPEDPDLQWGLARAYAPGEVALMVTALEASLKRNSNHIGSLLLLVDHSIDAEDYAQAGQMLDRIVAVNPWHPDAWAYQAVLASLQNQAGDKARENALKFWPNNPRVDHLIGQKLSQNYRFREGAAHQRQAQSFDPDYLPAQAQLAQDLLRLGDEAEGWMLAEEVQKKDAYDVEAYNLTTLHETMGKFVTLTNEDFVVRMNPHEAAIYGQAVLELLGEAKKNLRAKFSFDPVRPTIVEIFHEQKDFAVRTFGMPGNPGYLGVCFGNLITANGPEAHPGHPVNWQAVLWHEFCHVMTLQMTRNKMPRWLSEGISVYEELQANPAWGQRMTPRYREMVLEGELTPIAELSGAFLAPPTPEHLQFAYYEACLVVEFVVQKFGLEALKDILKDLGQGVRINQAIEQHTIPMAQLEQDFAAFARERAEKLAPGLSFERPQLAQHLLARPAADDSGTNGTGPRVRRPSPRGESPAAPRLGSEGLSAWIARNPSNYYALSEQARRLLEEKKLEAARAPLEKLVELYPGETGADSSSSLLAALYRQLGDTNAEVQLLRRIVAQDDEAITEYQRLMELGSSAQDWSTVLQMTRLYLAVDPLRPVPYRYLAQASEKTDAVKPGITAYRALLELDPADPAEIHFKLARLFFRDNSPEARRHVLQALEDAPRYQAALALLRTINAEAPPPRVGQAPPSLKP